MRNFSKKIITSVLTLVLTVVALGTGVFAWFSMNTKADAYGLTGSAQAGSGGFYISHSGQNGSWTNLLDLGDPAILPNSGFKAGPGDTFTDLTSAEGITIRKINFTTGNALEAAATAGYIEFDLYFLTGDEDDQVYLTNLLIETVAPTSWNAEGAVTVGSRVITTDHIMRTELGNALRVSFQERRWDDQKIGADAARATIFQNPASNDDWSDLTTKEFGNTLGFGGTVADNFAAKYYNEVQSQGILDNFLHVADRNVGGAHADEVIGANGLVDQLILVTKELDGDPIHSFGASYNKGGLVTVRIWLEGWDQEAFNALFDSQIEISMTFVVRKP